MRAVICSSYEGIDSLQVGEFDDPRSMPGALLVDVRAAAVNFADTLMVAGQYQTKPELPFVPGLEFSGVVVTADGAREHSPGDRVCGFVGMGAMAERALAYPSSTIRLPESVSFEAGACIPVAYGTSYHALVDRGDLVADETVLVLGAAGGVGLAAIQIGKAIGARVLAAVSSDEKADAARESGADDVIRYDQEPLRDGIARTTAGDGVDVVYDPVGGEMSELAFRSTKWGGRLLVVGFAAGQIPSLPLNLHLVKGSSAVGVFWGRFNMEEPDKSVANNEVIMGWIEDGTLRPSVQKTFPIDDAIEAFRWVAGRKAIGRVVIAP